MACTVAVEQVIVEHYDDQLRQLHAIGLTKEDDELRKVIKKFRDDELAHLNAALQHDALKVWSHFLSRSTQTRTNPQAPLYAPFTAAISAATRVAIWLSKRF
jgi:ubiquinone biosynthesis monooxygenase Coq7